MAEITNLARTNRDIQEEKISEQEGGTRPRYPSGMRLHIDAETLGKLGIKDLPKAGDRFNLAGLASVMEVRAALEEDGQESGLVLQVEEMGLEQPEASDVARAEILFGSGE